MFDQPVLITRACIWGGTVYNQALDSPSGQSESPPKADKDCEQPDENWAAGWEAAHTPESVLEPSPVPPGSPEDSPQTACWTH